MSGDLIVASFEVDRESSSFGFPFCAQVRKYFISFVFVRKNCRENNRKLRISIFIPTQRNPSFLSLKLRSFLMSWILFFTWDIRNIFSIFLVHCWFPQHLGDRMSSISHDLPLFHLWDYRNINLRYSLQQYRVTCQSPAISSSNNLPDKPLHPPLPGTQEGCKNNRDSEARLINKIRLNNSL